MSFLFVGLTLGLVAGAPLAALFLSRRHRRDLLRQERQMTAAVQQRYAAYLDLEARVKRLFERLDTLETETANGLARTGSRLRALDVALGGTPAVDAAAAVPEWLESAAAADGQVAEAADAVSVTLEAPPANPASIEEWEQRLEALAAEKHAEIERQERTIEELTARLHLTYEQASTEGSRWRHEAALWRERHVALESETALQVSRVRARAEEADELEARLSELQSAHDGLVKRIEEATARERAAEDQIARWRETCENLRAEQAAAEERFESLERAMADELAATRERLEGELLTLETARSAEVKDFERRLAEMGTLRGELEIVCTRVQELLATIAQREDDVASLQAALAQSERREAGHREELAALSEGLAQAQRDVAQWRTEARRAAEERDARVAELDARLDELESLSETLRSATELQLGRISELETTERRLSDELLERTQSLVVSKQRLEQAEQTLETVSRLLRESHAKG